MEWGKQRFCLRTSAKRKIPNRNTVPKEPGFRAKVPDTTAIERHALQLLFGKEKVE